MQNITGWSGSTSALPQNTACHAVDVRTHKGTGTRTHRKWKRLGCTSSSVLRELNHGLMRLISQTFPSSRDGPGTGAPAAAEASSSKSLNVFCLSNIFGPVHECVDGTWQLLND